MDQNQNIRISEDNLDQLIRVDLGRDYFEIQKERYDNDFDLNAQFREERNRSRNFRVYGVVNSTIRDCNNLDIEVYSDAGLTNLITTIQTSPYSFDERNVFGYKNGKYLVQLNNYEFDSVFLRIASDDFFYEDQVMEQRLVFYNADGEFVEYGTETVDIDVLAETTVEISNDFPFFFNKHWIQRDFPIKDEKPAKISFSFVEQTLEEGQEFTSIITLDKPSPFGNEFCLLDMNSPSLNYPFFNGQVAATTFDGENVNDGSILFREVNVPEGSPLSPFNGKLIIYVAAPEQASPLFEAGLQLQLDGSDYAGEYQILFSQDVNFEFSNSDDEVISTWVRRQIVLDADYNPDFENIDPTFSQIYTVTVGDTQDLTAFVNGEEVSFPHPLNWEENEQSKELIIQANNDLQIELQEDFTFSFIDKFRLEDGTVPSATVFIEDQTERGIARFNFGNVYKNLIHFKGREAKFSLSSSFQYSCPSVLRNGILWEGEDYEFYPSEDVTLVVRNKGLNTVLPVNTNLLIEEEQVFIADSEREFPISLSYGNNIPMKVKATYTGETGFIPNLEGEFSINGNSLPISTAGGFFGVYDRFKARLDGGEFDYYQEYQIDKDFTASFDDLEKSITLTAKGGGVFLDVNITIEGWVVELLQDYIPSDQQEVEIELFSNTASGGAFYEFVLRKNGYRDFIISPEVLTTNTEGIQYYLTNVINNVLTPYDQENGRGIYVNRSIYEGVRLGIGKKIPFQNDILVTQNEDDGAQGYGGTYMPLGKAYAHGVYMLSENSIPLSRQNLTSYGVIDNDGNVTEGAFWDTSPVNAIPATSDVFVTEPTRQVMDIYIGGTNGLNGIDGFRRFDYSLQGQGLVYSIGALNDELSAEFWWLSESIGIVDPDGNNVNGTLQQLLDTGNGDEITSGPILGEVVNNKVLRLISKFEGVGFQLDNLDQITGINSESLSISHKNFLIDLFNAWNAENTGPSLGNQNVNYLGTPSNVIIPSAPAEDLQELDSTTTVVNTQIVFEVLVPSLNTGDINSGRNGLGGFAIEI